MAKQLTYKGKTEQELKKMDIKEFTKLVSAKKRRSLTRGFSEQQKALLKKIRNSNKEEYKKPIKTHCRNMIIIPEMIGKEIHIHNGKTFNKIFITIEMLGHHLGEMSLTRKQVAHSAPGVGATKSSAAVSVK